MTKTIYIQTSVLFRNRENIQPDSETCKDFPVRI